MLVKNKKKIGFTLKGLSRTALVSLFIATLVIIALLSSVLRLYWSEQFLEAQYRKANALILQLSPLDLNEKCLRLEANLGAFAIVGGDGKPLCGNALAMQAVRSAGGGSRDLFDYQDKILPVAEITVDKKSYSLLFVSFGDDPSELDLVSLESRQILIDRLISVVLALLAMSLLGFLAVLAISNRLYRVLSTDLEVVRQVTKQLATGNFEERVESYRISEINDLASSLNRMRKQLAHLERVRSDFVANVSHELKTPVTSIKGYVETLREGASENKEDLERFLGIIARQTDRLSSIVDDLLTLSRLESERASELVAFQKARVVDVLQAVSEVCRARAESRDVRLEVECDPSYTVEVDRPLIENALINLVDNSIKYSGKGSQVKLRALLENDSMLLEVEDNGPGIPERHLPRLFERFYRVDKARSRGDGGTGLGLAIVKHISVIHGGSVRVSSKVGKGSVFTIAVPVKPRRYAEFLI